MHWLFMLITQQSLTHGNFANSLKYSISFLSFEFLDILS